MAKPSIIFFGNERLATAVSTQAPTVRALIDNGYAVKAVVSHNESTRSRQQRQLEVAAIAAEHHIPLLLPNKPADILEELQQLRADIGVLVAYGRIVPQAVIDLFPHGIINIHPSLLPKHRGSTPIESVILQGETETGVSIMGLTKAMDAGPIFAQESISLTGNESKQQLADTLLDSGSKLIISVLEQIASGAAQPQPQDESAVTTDQLISKQDGILDFQKPAVQLEREIRAYADWPKSKTRLADKDVVITAAHAIPSTLPEIPGHIEILRTEGVIMINTSDGYLCIDRLKPAGKGEMTTQAFLAGYRL